MANKRMKIDRTNDQLLSFSTLNNQHSIDEQSITDKIIKIDHTYALQTAIMHEHTTIVKDCTR
jgi:hypothetical protein